MVRVVGGRGFVDVSRPIIAVYGEEVVEVGLGVEFRFIGDGSYEDEEEKSRKKLYWCFWGFFTPLKSFCPKPVWPIKLNCCRFLS